MISLSERGHREDGQRTDLLIIYYSCFFLNRFNWSNVLYLAYLMPLPRTPWQVFSSVVIGYFLPFLNVNDGKPTQTGYTIHLYFFSFSQSAFQHHSRVCQVSHLHLKHQCYRSYKNELLKMLTKLWSRTKNMIGKQFHHTEISYGRFHYRANRAKIWGRGSGSVSPLFLLRALSCLGVGTQIGPEKLPGGA